MSVFKVEVYVTSTEVNRATVWVNADTALRANELATDSMSHDDMEWGKSVSSEMGRIELDSEHSPVLVE